MVNAARFDAIRGATSNSFLEVGVVFDAKIEFSKIEFASLRLDALLHIELRKEDRKEKRKTETESKKKQEERKEGTRKESKNGRRNEGMKGVRKEREE